MQGIFILPGFFWSWMSLVCVSRAFAPRIFYCGTNIDRILRLVGIEVEDTLELPASTVTCRSVFGVLRIKI